MFIWKDMANKLMSRIYVSSKVDPNRKDLVEETLKFVLYLKVMVTKHFDRCVGEGGQLRLSHLTPAAPSAGRGFGLDLAILSAIPRREWCPERPQSPAVSSRGCPVGYGRGPSTRTPYHEVRWRGPFTAGASVAVSRLLRLTFTASTEREIVRNVIEILFYVGLITPQSANRPRKLTRRRPAPRRKHHHCRWWTFPVRHWARIFFHCHRRDDFVRDIIEILCCSGLVLDTEHKSTT